MNDLSDIDERFTRFEARIHEADARDFRNARLQDIYNAAQVIERDQEQRQCMRNLRRIEPLLETLKKLASVLEADCAKTRIGYLWGPIKLLLQIAEEHDEGFKQLLGAYSQLAKQLAFVDQLSALVRTSECFKRIPADICGDVLEFHSETYGLFRRGGWTELFQASWKHFTPQLNCILQRLNEYSDLMQRFTTTLGSKSYGPITMEGYSTLHQGDQYNTNIVAQIPPESLSSMHKHWTEARDLRQRLTQDLEKRDAERQARQLRDTITWLQLLDQDQEQEAAFSRRADYREDGTCEWVLENTDFTNWLDLDHRHKYLWLKGKPGSGKTTITTFIIEKALFPPNSFLLHCLCSQAFDLPSSEFCTLVFRMFIGQILRKRPALVPYVHEEFVKKAEVSSLRVLAPLLRTLLSNLPSTFIIVDGLDECGFEAQSLFIKKLEYLLSTPREHNALPAPEIKILISSRDTKTIPARLRKGPTISLSKEAEKVSRDIKLYTMRSINELKDRFSDEQVERVAQDIVKKANGMFLWVRLVISTLLEQQSLQDLQDAVHRLPSDLKGLYQTILERIEHRSDDRQKIYVRDILTWMVLANQPLKSWELCAALVFSTPGQQLDEQTKLEKGVLDYCKPLLEEHADGTVSFVHFSVKEFLLKGKTGGFVNPQAGQYLLAAVCVRVLLSCDPFFSLQTSASNYRHVVLGFHDLLPYVHEHWQSHIFATTKKHHETLLDPAIPARLTGGNHADGLHCKTTSSTSSLLDPQQLIHSEIKLLQSRCTGHTRAENASAGLIAALNNAMEMRGRSEEDDLTASNGVDPIDDAYKCYRGHFEGLLQGNCPFNVKELGVSENEMTSFMTRHAQGAFLCHWSGCSRKASGFASAVERNSHYQAHFSIFRCLEPSCGLTSHNFANRAALRRHVTKYHDVPQSSPLPILRLSRSLNSASPSSRQPSSVRTERLSSLAQTDVYSKTQPEAKGQNTCSLADSSPSQLNTADWHHQEETRVLRSLAFGIQDVAKPPKTGQSITATENGEVLVPSIGSADAVFVAANASDLELTLALSQTDDPNSRAPESSPKHSQLFPEGEDFLNSQLSRRQTGPPFIKRLALTKADILWIDRRTAVPQRKHLDQHGVYSSRTEAMQAFWDLQDRIFNKIMRFGIAGYWSHPERLRLISELLDLRCGTGLQAVTCTAILCEPTCIPMLGIKGPSNGLRNEIMDSCSAYHRNGLTVSGSASSIDNIGQFKLTFQDEQTAVKVKRFIDAAQWIETQINTYLHQFLSGSRGPINFKDYETTKLQAQIFAAEISVLPTYNEFTYAPLDASASANNASSQNNVFFAIPHDWAPGDYYMNADFEREILNCRWYFEKDRRLSGHVDFLVDIVRTDVSVPEPKSISGHKGPLDTLKQNLKAAKDEFCNDFLWLSELDTVFQWKQYLRHVMEVLSQGPEVDHVLPFKLLDCLSNDEVAAYRKLTMSAAYLNQTDPVSRWAQQITRLAGRQAVDLSNWNKRQPPDYGQAEHSQTLRNATDSTDTQLRSIQLNPSTLQFGTDGRFHSDRYIPDDGDIDSDDLPTGQKALVKYVLAPVDFTSTRPNPSMDNMLDRAAQEIEAQTDDSFLDKAVSTVSNLQTEIDWDQWDNLFAQSDSLGFLTTHDRSETAQEVKPTFGFIAESHVYNCICGHNTDRGNGVRCNVCGTWQHAPCCYKSLTDFPGMHTCLACRCCDQCGSEIFATVDDLRLHRRKMHDLIDAGQTVYACVEEGCARDSMVFEDKDTCQMHIWKAHNLFGDGNPRMVPYDPYKHYLVISDAKGQPLKTIQRRRP